MSSGLREVIRLPSQTTSWSTQLLPALRKSSCRLGQLVTVRPLARSAEIRSQPPWQMTAIGLSWLCYYRALQIGPVSGVAAVDKLSVALAIALGVLFLGEHLSWQLLLGAALIMAGTLVIATL